MFKVSTNTEFLLLLTAALLLAGCTKPEEGRTSNTANNNAPSSQGATPVSGQPSGSAGVQPPSAGHALATADGDMPGVRVEIQELKRTSGDTINLKFAILNDSDKGLGFGYNFADKDNEIKDHGSVGGVQLIDPVGKKKYFVVRDTENACLCSRSIPDIQPKSRANLWAKFPAPPSDVQKITVVIPHFTPMDDVDISR